MTIEVQLAGYRLQEENAGKMRCEDAGKSLMNQDKVEKQWCGEWRA